MWITETIAPRTLVCLAVIMLPAQCLPATSCGCASGKSACQQVRSDECCCPKKKVGEGRCCSAARSNESVHSCCGKTRIQAAACKCGLNCRCHSTRQPNPVSPPVETNSQPQKVGGERLATGTVATVVEQNGVRCPKAFVADVSCLAALDRCVSLCRFIL